MATNSQNKKSLFAEKSGARIVKLPLARPTQDNAKSMARRYMVKAGLIDQKGEPLPHQFKIVNANELYIAHVTLDPVTGKIPDKFKELEDNRRNDAEAPEDDTVPFQNDITFLPEDNSFFVEQEVGLSLRAMETRLGITLPYDLFQEIIRDSVAATKEAQAKDRCIQFEEGRLPVRQLLPFGMQFEGPKNVKIKVPKISKSVTRLLNHFDHLPADALKWKLDEASLHLQDELKKKQDEQKLEDEKLKKEIELRKRALLLPGAELALGLHDGPAPPTEKSRA